MNTQNLEQAKQYALHRLEQELSPGLFYHSVDHTTNDVVPATERIAEGEGVDGEAFYLLLTAAWFHDLGFIEKRAGHEAVSARIASEVLPGFGYSEAQIQTIREIIMVTVLPQSPSTILEKILADADLDVLGREDFLLRNNNLRRELAFFERDYSDRKWYLSQLEFVESHTYFTETARALRDAGQSKNIADLKRILEELN